ncbi:MAG: 50S ribosomal protein L6 [Phycisphaerae bacterium]|jgi:large subunit ribosomal protein L6|nr:50S ribosomal protein L6 [Phycisphaerae bacterium]
MSRIGKKPIKIISGVTVTLSGQTVSVEGPKGKLSWTHRPEVTVEINDSEKVITVSRGSDDRFSRSLHGLTRSLIANMVEGCSKGFVRGLEVYGVGYGVQLQGNKLTVNCGFSHPVVFEVPAGVTVEIQTPQARGDTDPAKFTVSGADKQAVGQLAAKIRMVRKPEPYKGKGIRYAGEYVRRKVGKAFAGTGA